MRYILNCLSALVAIVAVIKSNGVFQLALSLSLVLAMYAQMFPENK